MATAYVATNPKTRAQLVRKIADGQRLPIFYPGPFGGPTDGKVAVQGPHFPEPHRWYGTIIIKDGIVEDVVDQRGKSLVEKELAKRNQGASI